MSRSAWAAWGFVAAVVALTAVRLAGLSMARAELYVDEAQYWFWSQTPAWGYFSKPPLLAWITGLASPFCGDGSACIRAPSTLAWSLTALFVFAIGRTLYGVRAAVFAGLSALLAPGAVVSSRILSTDAPLLTLWSAALWALVRLRAGGGWGWAVLLGLATGLGFLAKYAMLYGLGCAALAVVFDRATRRALLSWKGAVAGLIALAIAASNLIWNLNNGLVTARHTAGNAANDGLTPGVVEPVVFFLTQFALAGPVVFAGWLIALAAVMRGRTLPEARLLLMFSLPVVAVVTALAALSEANGNWAAPALIAVFVLGAATLSNTARGRRWLTAGLALGLAVQGAVVVLDARADSLTVAGKAPYAKVMGFQALTQAVADRAAAEHVRVVVGEARSHVALMTYHGRDRAIDVRAWPAADPADPQDHFQMTRPLTPADRGPVLAVAPCAGADRFVGWGQVTDLGPITVRSAGAEKRTVHLFRLEDPTGAPRRPGACADRR